MIRIFTKKSGGNANLMREFYVRPIIVSSRDLSFNLTIPINCILEVGEELLASTQNSEPFNIIAEGLDFTYSTTATFICTSLEYTPNIGNSTIDIANPNRDGSGTIKKVLTAASSPKLGCVINSIRIVAQQTTSPGMIRLYINDNIGGGNILFSEVLVPSTIQTATSKAFSFNVFGRGSLCLPPDYSITASTENGESFSVLINSFDWINV